MGKARSFSDASKDALYQQELGDELYSTSAQQNPYNLGSVHFSDQSGIGNFSQAGSDQRKANLNGALYTGNIGFELQTAVLDITTNTIDLLEDGSSDPLSVVSTDRIVSIFGETEANLITILGVQRQGQRLFLYGIFGNTITIIHTAAATDNTILCPGNTNFTLSDTEVVELVYDITNAKWRIVGGTGTGGGDVTFPLLLPKEDLTPAALGTATINVALNTGNAKQIQFPAGNINFLITGDPTNTFGEEIDVMFIQDSIGSRTLLTIDSRIKDSSSMNALIDSGANAKTIFKLITMDGGVSYHYEVISPAGTVSSGNLSDLSIDVTKNWLDFGITSLGPITMSSVAGSDIDLTANDILNVDRLQLSGGTTSVTSTDDVVWYVDPSGDLISNVGLNDGWGWSVNNLLRASFIDGIFQIQDTDDASSFRILNTTLSPSDRSIGAFELSGLNSDSTQLTMAFFAGSVVETTSLGSGSAQIGVLIDGSPNNFIRINDANVGDIDFLADLDMNAQAIILDATGFSKIQAGTNDVIQFTTGPTSSTVQLSLSSSSTVITQDTTIGGDLTLVDTSDTNPILTLFRNDSTPNDFDFAGQILFNANTTGTPTERSFGIINVTEEETDDTTRRGKMELLVADATNLTGTTYIELDGSANSGLGSITLTVPVVSENITPRNVGGTIGEDGDVWSTVYSTKFIMTTTALTGVPFDEQIILGHQDAMKFNVPVGETFIFHIGDGVDTAIPQFEIQDGDAVLFNDVSFATMNLQRTTLALPSGSAISQLHFQGNTDSASESIVSYATIEAIATNTAEGTAGDGAVGQLSLAVTEAGSTALVDYLRITGTSIIDMFKDLDMNTTNSILNMGGETINSITEDTTPVSSTDFVMTYDASAAALKKVLLDNLPGGSGTVTFPIDFPVDELGTLGDTTLNFSWVPSDRHAQNILLDGDLTIAIGTDLPADTLGLTMFKLKQDVTGGHSVTFTGIVNTSPTIDETPDNTTYIGVQRMDGESLAFTVGDKIFIGSSGEQWSEFPATETVDMANNAFTNYLGWTAGVGQAFDVGTSGNTNNLPTGDTYNYIINGFDRFTISETGVDMHNLSITNAAAISIVDVGTGTARGSISGDPGEAAMRLALASSGKFIISDVITNIAEFDNATGLTMIGTHAIDLNANALILDADADSKIQAGTDDVVQITTGGVVQLSLGNSSTVITQDTTIGGELDMTTNAISDVTILGIVDTGGTSRGNISGDITNGFVLSTASAGKFTILDVITPIATFDNATGLTIDGTHAIDLNANALILDADADSKIQAGTDDVVQITTGGVVQLSLGNSSTVITQDTFIGGKLDMGENFLQFTEIVTPTSPTANDGLIYVKDDGGGITTPFFLDSSGTETSMIASTSVSNEISQGDTSIIITDVGTGVINFVVDATALGNISIVGGWNIDNAGLNISSTTGFISFQNGFDIVNTSSTTTTFDVPATEFLNMVVGSETRLLLGQDVTISSDDGDDILFQEQGVTVGAYDGGTNNWVFNPANDVQLSPTVDLDLNPGDDIVMTPGSNIIMQPTGEINVFADFDMQAGDTVDFADTATSAGTSTQTLPAQPDGFIIIKVNGASKRVPFYVP